MKGVSYKTIRKNTTLTEFDPFKEIVLANFVKNVPNKLKSKSNDTNMPLDVYH